MCAQTDMEVVPILAKLQHLVEAEGLFAAGWLAYDAAPAFDSALKVQKSNFPAAWFGLFARPVELIDLPPPRSIFSVDWEPSITEQIYRERLRQIRKHLRCGNSYQVNFTFRLRSTLEDPFGFFLQMVAAQPSGLSAFIRTPLWDICSASPELFFRLEGRHLLSRPMKGTAPRGLWFEEDQARAAGLVTSPKARAENVTIVDMVRNDLAKISRPGSVQVPASFQAERYPTLWQLTTTVESETAASMLEIFRALFPPASITGAPKPKTMEIISALEDSPRKLYTGAIGFIAPNRRAQFNVAIRTVLVQRESGAAEYGVGGGIVWDSEQTAEFEECYIKARILSEPQPDFSLLESLYWSEAAGIPRLARHLRRLSRSAEYFSFGCDIEAIAAAIGKRINTLPWFSAKLRVLLEKNGGFSIEAAPLEPLPKPYRLALAASPVDASNGFLYHKTNHRDLYNDAFGAAEKNVHDVLLWNNSGELTESCIANVALEIDGRLYTPPVKCGLLPGVLREELLETGELAERVLSLEDVKHAKKIYLLNSIRGLWDVELVQRRPEEARSV